MKLNREQMREQRTAGKHVGTANFLRRFDAVEVAGQTPRHLVAQLQLWHGGEKGDAFLAKKALLSLFSSEPRIAEVWQHAPDKRRAQFILPEEFTSNMKSARVVLWWDWRVKKLRPAVYCPNAKTAQYVMAALGDLRACPCCDKLFVPDREDQRYCTTKCSGRFRKQKQREKGKTR